MLVLERKLGDFIVLNDDIFITVCETNQPGNRAKIAIEAPKSVSIARGELFAETEEVRAKLEAIQARKNKKRGHAGV